MNLRAEKKKVDSVTLRINKLKPSQNKKGRKKLQLCRFLNNISQLPAVIKYSKNGAAGNFFGPSYFDPALVMWKNLFVFWNS